MLTASEITANTTTPVQRVKVLFVAFLAFAISACSSGVQRAPETGLQQPQFDSAGEQAGTLSIALSDDARVEAADNLKFDMAEMEKTLRRALEVNNIITASPDAMLPSIEITVTSVRVRSNFSAIMFGFMAGDDHINGDVKVKGPDGEVLQAFGVSASYALGGLAGGQDSARLDWLYESFAERTTEELTGKAAAEN